MIHKVELEALMRLANKMWLMTINFFINRRIIMTIKKKENLETRKTKTATNKAVIRKMFKKEPVPVKETFRNVGKIRSILRPRMYAE